ncbi:UbiX family decarboxylase associated with menaquinone via futalosine [hydrothermal vent metagenome]|uniref:UbiX family decarboxylase associated with menaquinone via futalosine n=1 Tax=hydrothermal vent metagenome TaxID=652676 RepID=A0A3B1E8Z9_9ZZZZ
MKLIVAITGSSGVELGLKFVYLLPSYIKVHLITSNAALTTLRCETNKDNFIIQNVNNIKYYKDNQVWSDIASGSYNADAMIIIPCSMNTLAKCSIGISDTLITRVFSVMLKERKNIVLAPREMPYSTISLENMVKLSALGVSIAPPVVGYYAKQQTLEDMEDFMVGKWFDLLDIKNDLYKRWNGK